jgi:hypothetical protein
MKKQMHREVNFTRNDLFNLNFTLNILNNQFVRVKFNLKKDKTYNFEFELNAKMNLNEGLTPDLMRKHFIRVAFAGIFSTQI